VVVVVSLWSDDNDDDVDRGAKALLRPGLIITTPSLSPTSNAAMPTTQGRYMSQQTNDAFSNFEQDECTAGCSLNDTDTKEKNENPNQGLPPYETLMVGNLSICLMY
jgi:hypothetical protein